mgnify:CR=1 FL=1
MWTISAYVQRLQPAARLVMNWSLTAAEVRFLLLAGLSTWPPRHQRLLSMFSIHFSPSLCIPCLSLSIRLSPSRTCWSCIDIISQSQPSLSVIEWSSFISYSLQYCQLVKSIPSVSHRGMSDQITNNIAAADCPHCRNPLGSMECFDSHTVQRVRERNLRYKCLVCGYSTNKGRYGLLLHVRTHTGEKPFGCPYCSHTSAQEAGVKGHISRIHNGELSSPSSRPSRYLYVTTAVTDMLYVDIVEEWEHLWMETLDPGLWTADSGPRSLDRGLWTAMCFWACLLLLFDVTEGGSHHCLI